MLAEAAAVDGDVALMSVNKAPRAYACFSVLRFFEGIQFYRKDRCDCPTDNELQDQRGREMLHTVLSGA